MQRLKRAILPLLFVAVFCGLGCYWLYHLRMYEHPERIYPHYSRELAEYGQRLESGDVHYEPDRGYAIPQFLIDKGAKSITKHERCYVVWFSSLLDNPTPVLWYSPAGFDPVPHELTKIVGEPKTKWQQLSPTWGACYMPWWLNP